MLSATFLPGARTDFDESLDWYAARSTANAYRFALAVNSAIARAVKTAEKSCDRLGDAQLDVPVNRFPFRIVFRILPNQFLVIAIAHAKRMPDYWQSRFP